MKKTLPMVAIFLLPLAALAQPNQSQPKSPPAHAECKFQDGKTIKLDYSSPRMRGREIYGGLVPYGKVWRVGANAATSLTTDTGLTVNGKDVPAGSYTVFAIPNPDKWTLIISKKTGEWGIPYPGEADDLLRTDMNVSKTPSSVENFTIAFSQAGGSCVIEFDWANTRASVEFSEKK